MASLAESERLTPPIWRLRRGSNEPKTFRWWDRGGPVDMTEMQLLVRLVSWDGSAIELASGTDPNVIIEEQLDRESWGFFTIAPTEAQRDQLRAEVPGRYYFTALYGDGLQLKRPIGDGPLIIVPVGANV